MLTTSFERFKELAASQPRAIVPVYKEYLADLETPVSVLSRFTQDENVALFESVEGGERAGRYSFIGLHPHALFTACGNHAFLRRNGEEIELPAPEGVPLMALRKLLHGRNETLVSVPELPPLTGGAIGYIGYESVNTFEELPAPKASVPTPDAALMLTDEMIVFDSLRHTVKLIVNVHTIDFDDFQAAYADAERKIDRMRDRLNQPTPEETVATPEVPENERLRMESNMTRGEFCAMIEQARAEIRAGECIQVVLSQRFHAPLQSSPLGIYRALRLINPSPYTFFLKIGDETLVGSSPETMVKLEHGRSSLKPIAGTRPRGVTPTHDRELADELLSDEKERAEHLMLVDLGRNDLGRTAVPASVQVRSFMQVERYSHVMHLVSEVEAQLDTAKYDAFDLLRTTFPAGTLSGAPKIRAMELIHELEPGPRGVYGGAVGYFSYDGNMDMAITIRTLEIRGGKVYLQAGAGIVFDSVPENEYQETINKGSALFRAVEMANNGLKLNR
ncbi:MAG: anthranilate synthase component I [Victivallales bacterium]|nr:anthranilate synthase component I [Victivallales bacterium]